MQLLTFGDVDVVVLHNLRQYSEEHNQIAQPTFETQSHIQATWFAALLAIPPFEAHSPPLLLLKIIFCRLVLDNGAQGSSSGWLVPGQLPLELKQVCAILLMLVHQLLVGLLICQESGFGDVQPSLVQNER